MMRTVVVTGIGLVTPLGRTPGALIDRMGRGETAAVAHPFPTALTCPLYAPIRDFDADQSFPENKMLRMMNRDAQLAAVAARLAMQDAGIAPGECYASHEIALYGSTGLSGMAVEETMRLARNAAAADGSLDLDRFGRIALRRIRPVLSFKILANMPLCFVSIFETIRGPNAVYTPWEGQGAQAIAAGVRAIRRGDVPCALVGGCDVKTFELSLVSLQQLGLFDSWRQLGIGTIPGEGAGFLVLEQEELAVRRSARVYARVRNVVFQSVSPDHSLESAVASVVSSGMGVCARPLVVASGDGHAAVAQAEDAAFRQARVERRMMLRPKKHLGDCFAGAAAIQVGIAAELAARQETGAQVVANCCGHGTEQALFVLETV